MNGRVINLKAQSKYSVYVPILLSLLALAVSMYSLILSKESHYINKTQVLVGKTNELFLLLHEVDKLNNIEFDQLVEILTTLRENQDAFDKEKVAYKHYQLRMDWHTKARDENSKFWYNLLDNYGNHDIYWLESNIGVYRLQNISLIDFNTDDKEYLNKLKQKLQSIAVKKQ